MADFIGMEIAVVVVTASIVLAGILFGVGRAFGYKRIEAFGVEELIQSMINAAIIGSFFAIIELVNAVSSSVVSATCSQGTVIEQLICTLENINTQLFSMFQELLRTVDIVGYYQSMSLNFGAFAIEPFTNLSALSGVLSGQLLSMNIIMMLISLNTYIATFIGQNALALLFPIGLVLRALFATRKVGGFLIALGIGLYLFYPVFVLMFPEPSGEMNISISAMGNFSNNSVYATVPIIDLNDNYAIAGKLDVLSGRCVEQNLSGITNKSEYTTCTQFMQDNNITNMTMAQNLSLDFTGDLTFITQSNSNALAKTLLFAVVAPIFSLIVTVVFVMELSSLLGSEIGLRTFASI